MCLQHSKGNAVLAASVLTLALGADANLDFLKELAARNGGSARQIYDSTDVASQLQDFYASIPSPVLMDVSIAFDKRQVLPLPRPGPPDTLIDCLTNAPTTRT